MRLREAEIGVGYILLIAFVGSLMLSFFSWFFTGGMHVFATAFGVATYSNMSFTFDITGFIFDFIIWFVALAIVLRIGLQKRA